MNSFSIKKRQNPFLFQVLLSHSIPPTHQDGQSQKDLVHARCPQTWEQPTLPAPAETQREAAVTVSPISTHWRGGAWHGTLPSACISCSCWQALARAPWCLGTPNESNRRGVCCLQRSPGVVSQHITGTQETTLQSLYGLQILEELRVRGKPEYNMLFEPNSSELISCFGLVISSILSSFNRQWDVAWPQIHI